MDETDSEVEVTKVIPRTGLRKRTRSSTKMQVGPIPTSKKAKGKAHVSTSLKAKSSLNKYLYTKEA